MRSNWPSQTSWNPCESQALLLMHQAFPRTPVWPLIGPGPGRSSPCVAGRLRRILTSTTSQPPPSTARMPPCGNCGSRVWLGCRIFDLEIAIRFLDVGSKRRRRMMSASPEAGSARPWRVFLCPGASVRHRECHKLSQQLSFPPIPEGTCWSMTLVRCTTWVCDSDSGLPLALHHAVTDLFLEVKARPA